MTKFFRVVSTVFSPLVVPCYGVALALCVTPLSAVPFAQRMGVVGMCALFIFIIPALAVLALYRANLISDPGLNSRGDRTIPYAITILCYLLCAYYLYRIAAPGWLVGVMAGGLLTIVINLTVNLRWKISGHMAAMGGFIAITLYIAANQLAIIPMIWFVVGAFLAAGLVGTARLYLNRHTPMQVLAGTINGFLCVYLCCDLFEQILAF